jgi:hypothetical protein
VDFSQDQGTASLFGTHHLAALKYATLPINLFHRPTFAASANPASFITAITFAAEFSLR